MKNKKKIKSTSQMFHRVQNRLLDVSPHSHLINHLCKNKQKKHPMHKKLMFSIKDFFSKCDQIRRKLCVWSHLLKKSFMENFIFCAGTFTRFCIQTRLLVFCFFQLFHKVVSEIPDVNDDEEPKVEEIHLISQDEAKTDNGCCC